MVSRGKFSTLYLIPFFVWQPSKKNTSRTGGARGATSSAPEASVRTSGASQYNLVGARSSDRAINLLVFLGASPSICCQNN